MSGEPAWARLQHQLSMVERTLIRKRKEGTMRKQPGSRDRGRKEASKEGRKEGMKEGRKEGRNEGRNGGRKE